MQAQGVEIESRWESEALRGGERADRIGFAEREPQLVREALDADGLERATADGGLREVPGDRIPVGAEPDLVTRQPPQPGRVVLERRRVQHAQHARLEVVERRRAGGVQLARAQIDREGVQRRIAAVQVDGERGRLHLRERPRRRVGLGAGAGDIDGDAAREPHGGGAEAGMLLDGGATEGGDQRCRLPLHDDVELAGRAPVSRSRTAPPTRNTGSRTAATPARSWSAPGNAAMAARSAARSLGSRTSGATPSSSPTTPAGDDWTCGGSRREARVPSPCMAADPPHPAPRRHRLPARWQAAVLGLVVAVLASAGLVLGRGEGDGATPFTSSDLASEQAVQTIPKGHPADDGFRWPIFGGNPQRTQALAVERQLRPPFRTVWARRGDQLLEFTPVSCGRRSTCCATTPS